MKLLLKVGPPVLVILLGLGIWKAWEHDIREDERFRQQAAELQVQKDSLEERLARDSVVIDSLRSVAVESMERAEQAKARADTAREQAEEIAEEIPAAEAGVDSIIATLPPEIQEPLAQAVAEERGLHEREKESLRDSNESLRESLEEQNRALAALTSENRTLIEQNEALAEHNRMLFSNWKEAAKRADPGFFTELTQDIPEKLVWIGAAFAAEKYLVK